MSEIKRGDSTGIRLRWRDLDHQGHVYHAAMVELLDEARTSWFGQHLEMKNPDSYVVVQLNLTFEAELKISDEWIQVDRVVLEIGTTSMTLDERMTTASGRSVAKSTTTVVFWDAEAHAPRPITASERESASLFRTLV